MAKEQEKLKIALRAGESLDADFMHEIANTPRGRGVLSCIQCGRCTSSCPVARTTDGYNPKISFTTHKPQQK